MTSGRVIAQASLKSALLAAGWRARAAGWFTKEMAPCVTAVLTVGSASEHHAPGEASVTMYLGLRDEKTERIVDEVSGPQTPMYRGRTWVTALGYLLPDAGFTQGERDFNESNSSMQAAALVGLLTDHAEPRLRQIAGDTEQLVTLADGSVTDMGPAGLCRITTLRFHAQGLEAASEYVNQRLLSLGDRTDPAAELEREVADRILAALRTEPTS